MKNKYLLYTILTFRKEYYLPLFRIMLKSIVAFSSTDFDLCIITNKSYLPELKEVPELQAFQKVYYHIVPDDEDLFHALMRKCDIANLSDFLNYDKIMFLDCDIIVQGDLVRLFKQVRALPNKIYAPESGSHYHKFWGLCNYNDDNVNFFRKYKIKSFSSGSYLFKPSIEMKNHLLECKKFALSYKGSHFYDQSFYNYYFNTRNMSSTRYWDDIVLGFPDYKQDYPDVLILHFCGIGMYKSKKRRMTIYLNRVSKQKHLHDRHNVSPNS